ncbi:unnamed protein product [Caenorhabditis brenneri]
MKLLKIPQLAQEQILKCMDYRQIFFLSLSSKKMFRLIQSFRWKLRGFFFNFTQRHISIILDKTNGNHQGIFDLITFHAGSMCSELLEYSKEWTPVSMKYTCQNEESDVVLDIQKHIFQLFCRSPDFRFTAVIESSEKYRYVPNVKRVWFQKNPVKVDFLEQFIRDHSELEAIVTLDGLIGEVDQNSKIFEIPNLRIENSTKPCTHYLDNFKGRCAVFCQETLPNAKLFIEKWMRNEYSENIQHVFICLPKGQKFSDTIFENVEKKNWDTGTMPKAYPYNKRDAYYIGANSWLFGCEGRYYLEREADGKVATVGLAGNHLTFSVWEERPYGI